MIGLGYMGMTGFEEGHMYGPADEQEAIATIHCSLELDGNFLDTADLCGLRLGYSSSSPPNADIPPIIIPSNFIP